MLKAVAGFFLWTFLVTASAFASPAGWPNPPTPQTPAAYETSLGQYMPLLLDSSGNLLVDVAVGGGGGGGGSSGPTELTSTNSSGTITTGGTFQTWLAYNATRKGCFIQNPPTATENIQVFLYNTSSGTPTIATSTAVTPGNNWSCAVGGYGVVTDQIAIEAATAGHAFTANSQ